MTNASEPAPGPEDQREPGSSPTAEGTGETVGEAKWAALRELERRFPGVDKGRVRFSVLSEGHRGLLGVGYAPAHVVAELAGGPPSAAEPTAAPREPPGSPAARVRAFLERVCAGISVSAPITISETEDAVVARLSGPDVGILIGKHGQTIDAIQYLANAIVWREGEERRDVIVDAADYRRRRQVALERTAERAVQDALRSGTPVALEPMTAVERKVVHLYLQDRGDVTTSSEGTEPNRHVVVSPARD